MEKGAVALAPALSETLAEKEAVVAEIGIPETIPVLVSDKPAGVPPDVIDHV
jgi:hypothetical protein